MGHWENDTLWWSRPTCAPTIRRGATRAVLLLTRRSQIVERFTRVSPTELFYRFTVEDDELYTKPWTGESLDDAP